MKDSTDAKEKTSRRSFAKSVATALVAAPVVSSLSSCAKPQQTTNPSSPPSDHYLTTSGNPPVIIDGGSLSVSSPATLRDVDDTETPPKKYDHKFVERNTGNGKSLGPIKKIRINNDYGDSLLERELQGSETLKVYLWIQKVKAQGGETGNEDDDDDRASYDDIADLNVPEMVIQGGVLEIRSDKPMPKVRKLLKRTIRNPKRYERHDWDNKHFRITQVKAWVSSSATPIFESDAPDKGFRITLIFA